MNDVAATTVMRYIDEQLFEPRITWSKVEFSRGSYSRWAAYEILEFLLDKPFGDAEMLIEDFIIRMFYLSYIAEKNDKSSLIFTTAIDVAEDILFLM